MTTPNFVYIGLIKTGSSWLFHNFQHHPEVFIPEIKYTNYFNVFPHRSIEWYLQHFRHVQPQHRAVGEFGIGYLPLEHAIEKLYRINPKMKFIYFVRNTLDHQISVVFQLKRSTADSPQALMEQLVARHARGHRPSAQLPKWIERFGREQFLFRRFDDIKTRPDELLREVYEFLGVPALPPAPLTAVEENRRQAPRSVLLGSVSREVADRLRQFGLYDTLARLKQSPRVRRLVFKDVGDAERAEISELRARYATAFADEDARVLELTGLVETASLSNSAMARSG
mgnify:FL=1